ncbi:MAG: hypothetical protein IJD94_02435 [Clostridia bacterium]|nr:hypothetical protein [Clostridia bacterium]
MAAAAAQKAPEQKKKTAGQGAPAQGAKKAGIREKLYDLPQAAGIAILCVMLVLSLFVGNFRALSGATPKAFLRQGDVKSIVEDRIGAAENVIGVARRIDLNGGDIDAAVSALARYEEAGNAREISRADQALSAAIAELTTANIADGEAARSMRYAADAFAEQGSFLRQEARAYNEKAEKAEKIYESLPTRFLYAEPDMYEGI